MSITQTSCPECEKPVSAGESCPHCGAEVTGDNEFAIETGGEYVFVVDGSDLGLESGELEVTLRVHAQWADLVSRTVFAAEVLACVPADGSEDMEVAPEDIEPDWFLIEELKGNRPKSGTEPEAPESLSFRRPIAENRIDGRPVFLYRNEGGISLAELVALADRQLTIRQVADVFGAVLDGLRGVHESSRLHLTLSPELIRVKPTASSEGIPLGRRQDPDPRTDGGGPSGSGGMAETETEEAGESAEWGTERYDETKPQPPLGIRLSDMDSEDLSSLTSDVSSLGDETSEVDESGIAYEEHWIRDLGIEPPDPTDIGDDDSEGTYSDSRRDADRRPEAGVGLELEAVFDTTAGLFERDDIPDEIEAVPGFSPPEAFGRGGSDLDAVSDVFSAGMVLYYLIAGRRPPASVYTRHAPAVPARNFRPEFPPGLGPVVKRATRPDPEMRYPDLSSMETAFENALEAIEDRTPERRQQLPTVDQAVDRHAGIAKRKRNPVNQDNVFEGASEDGEFSLVVVADGVSTASFGSGEIASEILIEVGEEVWDEILPAYLMEEGVDEVEAVEHILEEANARIVEYVNDRHTPFTGSAHEVMGTTALVALYNHGTVTLGAVGDSRGYLQRGPGLEQLTIDHNLWSLSILEGLPADDALSMPRGDALARCLGTFIVEDGVLDPVPPGYDVFQFPVTSGDTLLLTTDGLVDFAGGNVISAEENILATLLAEPDPALACLELILLANRGGGGDNIGLGIIRYE